MTDPKEMKNIMIEEFKTSLSIPENYEYVSSSELSEMIETSFDGAGFVSSEYVVYTDFRGLPEEFSIVVISLSSGEKVEKEETHITSEAINITERKMEEY